MFVFKYEAIDDVGKKIRGSMYSSSEQVVCSNLQSQRLQVLQIQKSVFKTFFSLKKISVFNISVWAGSISQLLSVGISIIQVLELTAKNSSVFLKSITKDMQVDLEQGLSLTKTMEKYKTVFGDVSVGLILVAEKTGKLAQFFKYIAEHYSFMHEIKRKIKMAMYYPLILLLIIIPVSGYFLFFLIPLFAQMIQDSGGELPLMTRMICGLAQIVKSCPLIIWLGLVAAVGWAIIKRRKIFERFFDLFCKLPIIGDILQAYYLTLFFKVFGEMIDQGMSLEKSLSVGGNLLKGNYTKEMKQLKEDIVLGRNLQEGSENMKFFTEISKSILNTAAQTCQIPKACQQISEIYEEKMKDSLDKLNTTIQPAFMLFFGVIFLILVFGGVLPLYQSASAF